MGLETRVRVIMGLETEETIPNSLVILVDLVEFEAHLRLTMEVQGIYHPRF